MLVCWHICFVLYLLSFVCALFQSPEVGFTLGAPDGYGEEDLDKLKQYAFKVHPYVPVKIPGTPRFCTHCRQWQSVRAQHCLICNLCIRRHDHHSLMLDQCVGLGNFKPYVLFVFYGFLCFSSAALWALFRLLEIAHFVTVGPSTVENDGSVFVVVCLVVLVVGNCLFIPTFLLSLVQVLSNAKRNMTQSEKIEWKAARLSWKEWKHDKGNWVSNIKIMMGSSNAFTWLFPFS